MKSIREMDEDDRNRIAAKDWDDQAFQKQKKRSEAANRAS